MENPILALTPSGYKAEKVYSVLPSDGSGDFTFDRANGLATRINKDGLVEEVANDTPRFNYLNSTCPSLLLEAQRTNLLAYSEDFSNAYWNKLGASIVSNQTVSPDGTLNADMLLEDTSNGIHIFYRNNVNTGAGANTLSVKVKANGRNWVLLYDTEQLEGIYFDLQNGVAGSTIGSPDAFSIKALPNGWYDVSLTTTGISKVDFQVYASESDGNHIYQGDGVSGINVWGAQLEFAGYPTSYIPTSGTTATRFVDICKDAGNAALFNVSELSLFFDVNNFKPDTGSLSYIVLTDGQSSPINMVRFEYKQDRIEISNYVNGTLGLFYTITSVVPNQRNKMALTISTARTKVYFNGVLKTTTAGDNIPSGLNSLSFTNRTKSGGYFEGEVQDARVYNRILTETEAIKLTT